MIKGTVWCVGVCDFWHCLSWPYFHISAYLCTFSVFLHFPTLLYFCISVTVLQICVGVCTIMLIAATWCRRLIATTSNWFALQITASPLFAFCFAYKYLLFSLQITALPSFSTSSPQCFSIRLQGKFPLPKFLGNPVDLHSWLDNQRSRSKLLLRIGSDHVLGCNASSRGAKTSLKAKKRRYYFRENGYGDVFLHSKANTHVLQG